MRTAPLSDALLHLLDDYLLLCRARILGRRERVGDSIAALLSSWRSLRHLWLESHSGEGLESHSGESLKSHSGESLESHSGESLESHSGEGMESHSGESLKSHSGESLKSH